MDLAHRALATGAFFLMFCLLGGTRGSGDPPGSAPAVETAFRGLAGTPLWPGFVPGDVPLAVYDGTVTWFFRHPNPPAGCDSIRGRAATCSVPGRHADVRANTSAQIGGASTATLVLPPRSPNASADSTLAWAAVAVHETFHVFQRAHHPKWAANEADLFTYPSDSESVATGVGREIEALRRALASRDDAGAAAWSATALAARQDRFAAMPAAAVAYERANEWNEGLAQYVQDRALEAATRQRSGAARLGGARIEREHAFAADAVRARTYVAGEALARLLDRLEPNWKDSLEADDTRALDVLLAGALARHGARPREFSLQESQVFRADGATSVRVLAEGRERRRRDFLSRPGPRVVFETAAGDPLWPNRFDPSNVRVLGGGAVLHERWLALGNGGARIEVLDHACLSEAAGSHPLFEGVRRLTVTGLAAAPLVLVSDSTTVVRAPGLEASLRAVHVESSGDTLRLRLGR